MSNLLFREHVARILRSPDFAGYPRSCAFLTYVVEAALSGRGSATKESIIGVDALGRAPGYDSKSDSIVRAHARRVRERLGEYYLTAGKSDPVRIEIPKGSYIPEFRLNPLVPAPAPVHGRLGFASRRIAPLAAAAVLLVVGIVLSWTPQPAAIRPSSQCCLSRTSIQAIATITSAVV
jgi:hypothetical protein